MIFVRKHDHTIVLFVPNFYWYVHVLIEADFQQANR